MNMKFTKEKEEQLAKLMKEYNVSDLGELIDIFPDLDILPDEDELPQLPQQGVTYKELAVPEDEEVAYSYPFNN